MKRRAFLGLTGAAAVRLGITTLGRAQDVGRPPRDATAPGDFGLQHVQSSHLCDLERPGIIRILF